MVINRDSILIRHAGPSYLQRMTEDRKQMTEDRKQMKEDRGQS